MRTLVCRLDLIGESQRCDRTGLTNTRSLHPCVLFSPLPQYHSYQSTTLRHHDCYSQVPTEMPKTWKVPRVSSPGVQTLNSHFSAETLFSSQKRLCPGGRRSAARLFRSCFCSLSNAWLLRRSWASRSSSLKSSSRGRRGAH